MLTRPPPMGRVYLPQPRKEPRILEYSEILEAVSNVLWVKGLLFKKAFRPSPLQKLWEYSGLDHLGMLIESYMFSKGLLNTGPSTSDVELKATVPVNGSTSHCQHSPSTLNDLELMLLPGKSPGCAVGVALWGPALAPSSGAISAGICPAGIRDWCCLVRLCT